MRRPGLILAAAVSLAPCLVAAGLLASSLVSSVARSSPYTAAYPLKVSPNGRYLEDQNNVPFLVVGDSPQAMISNLSTSDADAYLANRQAQGFNTLWLTLWDNTYGGGRADYSTYDGIVPFTTPGDLATPNPAYWARADAMLQLASTHGMEVFLNPVDCAGTAGLPLLRSNGLTKAFNFGVFLGTRYKGDANITWLNGIDFQTYTTPSDDQLCQAVAKGIASVAPSQLQTVELNYYVSASQDDPTWHPPVNVDYAYTYAATYAEVLNEYNKGTMPVFLGEAAYEGEAGGTLSNLRRQEWWTALSGSTGQLFGNHYTWQFLSGWQSNQNTVGYQQMGYQAAFMAQWPWWTLVPDQSHRVVTAGYGTYDSGFHGKGALSANDYLTAARTPDGSLALAYLPSVRTITVDLSQLSGAVTARWYDPTNNSYATISGSPFANLGSQQFTPPGANSAGDGDWVLVLQSSTSASTSTDTPVPPTSAATPTAVATSTANPFCISGDASYCAAPIHWWTLDEGSGSLAQDSGTSPGTGTLQNNPAWTGGKYGSALSFNGSNQYVSVGNAHLNGLGKLTFEAWFKRSTINSIVSTGEEILPNADISLEAFSDGMVYANIGDGTTVAYGCFASNDTNWHHIAFVFDGSQTGNANRLKGYLDGIQQTLSFDGTTIPAAIFTRDIGFSIGSLGDHDYTAGLIDDVRIYDYPRTPAQITLDMNGAGTGLTPTATAQATPTVTPTPLPASTATPTSTPTATPTNTPVPATPTMTPTSTPLPTPTNTPVPTPTPTNTPVPASTPTSTPVPATPTMTPTSTPLPPITDTPAPTPTPTNTPVPATPTDTPQPTATNTAVPATPTATLVPSTPTPTSTSSSALGLTTVGSIQDDFDSNYIQGSKIVVGAQQESVQSISAYVGAVDTAPNNQYSFAIYGDSNGSPGKLLAQTTSGSLKANSWNTLPISASLVPNTTYWLMYNTNGTNGSVNDLYYNTVAGGLTTYSSSKQPFGTWPSSFAAAPLQTWQYSVYATVSP